MVLNITLQTNFSYITNKITGIEWAELCYFMELVTKLSLNYIISGEALVALIHVVHTAVGHPVPGQTDPKVQEDDRIELTVVHKKTKASN